MNKVQKLADAIGSLPQVVIDIQHHVNNGMYARTMFVPAGVMMLGDMHLTDHLAVFAGDASLIVDGEMAERITGYHVFTGSKGVSRAMYAHSDCWFTAVFRTDKTDLTEIENEISANPEKLQTRNPALTVNRNILIGV